MLAVAVAPLDLADPVVAEAVLRIQHRSYAVEAALIGFDGIPPLHERVSDMQALAMTILGVVDDPELLALLGYTRDGDRAEIDRLAVHPAHFRRGLARRLLDALHAREAGASRFDVSTGRDNTPAIALYEQFGYRRLRDEALPEGVVVTRLSRFPHNESGKS